MRTELVNKQQVNKPTGLQRVNFYISASKMSSLGTTKFTPVQIGTTWHQNLPFSVSTKRIHWRQPHFGAVAENTHL